jgi:hypothetical protein
MTNQSLITRLREAEGADRDLDLELERRFRGEPLYKNLHRVPEYTASLDAALALVAEVLPGCTAIDLTIYKSDGDVDAQALLAMGPNMLEPANHKSPAIALLIALLQAQGAQE